VTALTALKIADALGLDLANLIKNAREESSKKQ
jgi:hypothetical protein